MYQKITIVGYVGKTPHIQQTQAGDDVCNFSVAVTKRWRRDGGDLQERTTWFQVSAWRHLANLCATYLLKGDPVLIEGEIRSHAYINAHGDPRSVLDVVAETVRFLPRGRDDGIGEDTGKLDGDDKMEIPF